MGVAVMGLVSIPAFAQEAGGTENLGRTVYNRHCAACHGDEGDGLGMAAVWLFPKPRNFSSGLYKIQSTPAGSLPTDEDLLRSVTRGLGGSSMPGFAFLPESERRAVVGYVKHLTARVGPAGQRQNLYELAAAEGNRTQPIVIPPEPPFTFESITRGRELYGALQCAACHGETGAGDGPSSATMVDAFGVPVPPRDFNSGAFRGGSRGVDLYTRIAVGIGGTPMVAYPDEVLTPDDRWALVHYVQSLRRKDAEVNDMLTPEDGIIPVLRVSGELPMDPHHPDWEGLDSVWVPLMPLWPEPMPIPAVSVRAVHDGRKLVVQLQWRDASFNGLPLRSEDFQDGVAVQFSLTGGFPFLGMGEPDNPVNLWQWRAGSQQAVGMEAPDASALYPAMYVDVQLDPTMEALYRTAEAAGNHMAARTLPSPVEDMNARGFGTTTTQSARSQNVQGRGVWRDEAWTVVMQRDLISVDPLDAQFRPGGKVPVSFAVWNGEQRDRNGRKVISSWFQLMLQP